MNRVVLFSIIALFMVSCSPMIRTNVSKSYTPTVSNQPILVLDLETPVPVNAENLGEIKIGDNGFSVNCTYQKVIQHAKDEARQIGGNAIKITAHKLPSVFGSSCHRISAKILRLETGVADTTNDIEEFEPLEASSEISKFVPDYSKIRLSINFGPSFRFAKIPDSFTGELRDYVKKLKWGTHLDADALYFFSETTGVGIKYNQFDASNSMSNVTMDVDEDGISESGKMMDDIRVSFVGPMLQTRLTSQDCRNAFFTNASIGYLSYKNNSRLVGFPIDFKRGTVGVLGGVGYQVGLSKDASIAIELSYLLGTLKKVDVDFGGGYQTVDLEDNEYENLGRINLTVGLVLHQ